MSGWTRVGAGCFARRCQPLDVTVGVVAGADGLLVVDSRATLAEADRLRADLGARWPLPVRHLVNTHSHFDHCFGNAAFADVPIWGHADLPELLRRQARAARAEAARHGYRPDELPLAPRPPRRLVAGAARIDLAGVAVWLRFLGPGHTGADLVAHVPSAGVVFCGDLVEESGPPQYGADSFPLDWPDAIDRLLALAGPDAVFVPGHGAPVDAAFVRAQRDALSAVAEAIRRAHAAGLGLGRARAAVAAAGVDVGGLGHAVRRGYAQLRAGALTARQISGKP